MSTSSHQEDPEVETQQGGTVDETQPPDDDIFEMSGADDVVDEPSAAEVPLRKASAKRAAQKEKAADREPGKSLFPFSKVQKIIKADEEIPIVAKEATFLISLATEEFIKRLCQAGQLVAHNEKRSTLSHKDIATVVRKADEFLFLEEIIPIMPLGAKAAKPKIGANKNTKLDQFVMGNKNEGDIVGGGDVIMNEDGTMYAAGRDPDSEDDILI